MTADPQTTNGKLHLLWIGCGTEDSLFGPAEDFSKFLDDARIEHVFRKSDEAHAWMVWRRYLNEVARLLF